MLKSASSICAAFVVLASTMGGTAQQTPPAARSESVKRTALQRFEVPGTAYETVIGIAEIAPNISIGRHTHPGPESGFIIEGGFELLIDGEPTRQLKAGHSYKVPPRTPHDAKTGSTGAKVIATYVVEKGQPLSSPVK